MSCIAFLRYKELYQNVSDLTLAKVTQVQIKWEVRVPHILLPISVQYQYML